MEDSQLQQATEPGITAPKTNGKEANPKESHDDDVSEEESSQDSSSKPSDGASNGNRKNVPTPASRKRYRGKTESLLTEIKERMATLKTIASDTFSKKILDFLKEESQRQAARDDCSFENNRFISSTATSCSYVTSHLFYV